MLTEAQKRAKEKYRKKTGKVTIEFYPQEAELLQNVKSQPSQQGYIKENALIQLTLRMECPHIPILPRI